MYPRGSRSGWPTWLTRIVSSRWGSTPLERLWGCNCRTNRQANLCHTLKPYAWTRIEHTNPDLLGWWAGGSRSRDLVVVSHRLCFGTYPSRSRWRTNWWESTWSGGGDWSWYTGLALLDRIAPSIDRWGSTWVAYHTPSRGWPSRCCRSWRGGIPATSTAMRAPCCWGSEGPHEWCTDYPPTGSFGWTPPYHSVVDTHRRPGRSTTPHPVDSKRSAVRVCCSWHYTAGRPQRCAHPCTRIGWGWPCTTTDSSTRNRHQPTCSWVAGTV